MIDSILNIVVQRLNRQDTSLKVLVLINHHTLSFPDTDFADFFSIGFDTLRGIDNDYIFDYYWNQQNISVSKNNGLNKFRSQDVPLDINATSNKNAIKIAGLKILYDIDYRSEKHDWSDLIKAIVYAVQNPDTIKREQRRDTVRYNTNGWYVSLMTIDTVNINKIIGKQKQAQQHVRVPEKSKTYYWIGALIGFMLLFLVIYKFK
jgi:hypothetical protein